MKIFRLTDHFYHLIETKTNTPRWIIFVLDLGICALSIVYAIFLRFNFNLKLIGEYNPLIGRQGPLQMES